MNSNKEILFLRELLDKFAYSSESEEIKISNFKNKLSKMELLKLSKEKIILTVENNALIKKYKKDLLIIKDIDIIECDYVTISSYLQKIQEK